MAMHIKIPVYIYAAKQVYGRSLQYYKSVTKEQVFIWQVLFASIDI